MINQKKILDKLKERIRIWNITFLITSTLTIIYIVISETLGYTNDKVIGTARVILYILFALPLGVSMGLQITKNLVKKYKEDLE